MTGDLQDVKAQQTALGISLIRLKQQVPGPDDGVLALHTLNPLESPHLASRNASVAPPPLGGHPHDNVRRRGTDSYGEHIGDGANTLHKIEFPKFDGTHDRMLWLNCY
jgi:hypothetical protein